MKTLLNYFVLMALTSSLFFSACVEKEVESDNTKILLNGWIKVSAPKENSKLQHCANRSDSWKLEIVNNSLKSKKYSEKEFSREPIKKVQEKLKKYISENKNERNKWFESAGFETHQHFEPYKNGWLVGTDVGEWGGELFWLSGDLEQKIDILKKNIQGIVKVDDEVFILSGLQHMEDEGAIWKLVEDEKGMLETKLIKDVGTQPKSFSVESKHSFIVFFDNSIRRVKTSGEIEVIQKVNFSPWYPNSIERTSNGDIYVGMPLFVVRLIPDGGKFIEEWYVPDNCQNVSLKEYGCVCEE